MIIKCYFCQQDIANINISLLRNDKGLAICKKCPHSCTTTVKEDGSFVAATIYFERRERVFRADFVLDDPHPDFRLTEIIEHNEHEQSGMVEYKHIVKIPFIPTNITPHNILNKLPTLIVFS